MPARGQERENALRWEQFLWRNFPNVTNRTKIFYFIALLVFRKFSYRTYRNGLNQVPQSWGPLGPQKIRAVLVLYLLSGICILVCSCTGCGNSKIYLCLEDNRSSFSRLSWKPETKDASINIRSLLLAKNMFLGKQKFEVKQLKLNKFIFDVKQLKINKFMFDVRQLKMNRFIKSISDLIISTSNATLESPSLRLCSMTQT